MVQSSKNELNTACFRRLRNEDGDKNSEEIHCFYVFLFLLHMHYIRTQLSIGFHGGSLANSLAKSIASYWRPFFNPIHWSQRTFVLEKNEHKLSLSRLEKISYSVSYKEALSPTISLWTRFHKIPPIRDIHLVPLLFPFRPHDTPFSQL